MKQSRWVGRKVRGMRPDRNPLRRRADRIEAFIFGGLIVAAVAGTPVVAVTTSHWAHAAAARAARDERDSSYETRAVVLTAPDSPVSGYSVNGMDAAWARWTTRDGHSRTGQVTVPSGSPKDSAVVIWTDGAGNATYPPPTPAEVADQATFATVVASVATVLACLIAALTTRLVVNRRRMTAWDADWAVKAPIWTRQMW